MGPAGVVDHDVEVGARRADQLRPVAGFRHIGLHEGAAHLLGHPLAALRVDVGDDDLRAFLREALRDAGAEAGAAAGDDRQLSFQPHFSSSSRFLNGLWSHSSST
jgi:hypothetical protein